MEIVDNIVIPFLRSEVYERWIVVFALFVVGGILGMLVRTGEIRLHRGGYFVFSAIGVGILLALPALYADYSDRLPRRPWLAGASAFGMSLAVGYAVATLAKFRSLDAFGSKTWSVLAYLPVANVALFLIPSRGRDTYARRDGLDMVAGANGVIAGLVVLATALTVQHALKVGNANRFSQPGAQIENTLELAGLRATLRDVAGKVTLGVESGPLTLIDVSADRTTLRMTWRLASTEGDFASGRLRLGMINFVCQDARFYRPLLLEGATFRMIFVTGGGAPAGEQEITQSNCGA